MTSYTANEQPILLRVSSRTVAFVQNYMISIRVCLISGGEHMRECDRRVESFALAKLAS
jgi:hypothetical protein